MYESERIRVLHWKYTVLSSGKMSTLHSSYFPQLTFTASKRREMALNQMEQLHLKWQVPLLKDPALLSHLLSVVKLHVWIKEKLQNPFTGSTFVSVIFGLIILALQCCSQRLFSILILQTNLSRKHKNKLSQCLTLWKHGNCQHTFSGISLKKKQTKNKKTKAFYCPVYMKVYVWKNVYVN